MSTPASTEIALNSFSFGATVKTRAGTVTALSEALPDVSTVSLVSKDFTSYEECISSCKQLMADIMSKIDGGKDLFKLGSEVNPLYSGTPTISKDWGIGEISRIWVYDKSMEKAGQIHAMGQARVFGAVRQPSITFN